MGFELKGKAIVKERTEHSKTMPNGKNFEYFLYKVIGYGFELTLFSTRKLDFTGKEQELTIEINSKGQTLLAIK